jgi:hypothetical protein
MAITAKLFFPLGLASLLCGCAIVTIDGSSKIESIRFGVLRIQPNSDARIIVYRTTGLGLIPGRTGVTLGFLNEKTALVYNREDCRVVIFELPTDELARLKLLEMVKNSTDICALNGGKDEKIDPTGNDDGPRTGRVRAP